MNLPHLNSASKMKFPLKITWILFQTCETVKKVIYFHLQWHQEDISTLKGRKRKIEKEIEYDQSKTKSQKRKISMLAFSAQWLSVGSQVPSHSLSYHVADCNTHSFWLKLGFEVIPIFEHHSLSGITALCSL